MFDDERAYMEICFRIHVREKVMKLIKILILTFITTFFVLSTVLFADQTSMENGAIKFNVPSGFTTLKADEIKIKFPSVNAPRFVVGNENRTVTVAYDIKDTGMPSEKHVDAELPNAQMRFKQVYDRLIPGIKWINNDIIDIKGKKWILFEITSNAIDTDIHNIILMTFFRGRIFIVNFNSTIQAFQEVEAEIKQCIQTLNVKE